MQVPIQQVQKKLSVKVLLRIAVIWKNAQKTDSVATLNGNAYSFAKERASPLVTRSFNQSARDFLRARGPEHFDSKTILKWFNSHILIVIDFILGRFKSTGSCLKTLVDLATNDSWQPYHTQTIAIITYYHLVKQLLI